MGSRKMRVLSALLSAQLFLCDIYAAAATEGASPEDVKQHWISRLEGRHFSAHVRLEIEREGWKEAREIDVWRDDQKGSGERLMARFEAPPDLRGLALLYLEHPDRSNDYFLYEPALRRVRRVAERLAREDVYGVDLEYLGLSAAQLEPTAVDSVVPVMLGERHCLRLTERARQSNPRFDERVVWLDPTTWIPLQAEHRRQGRVVLRAQSEEIREIQGVATPVRMLFERPEEHERVRMSVDRVDYESPIPDTFFSTMQMVNK
jgi:hypothetical protein